MSEETVQTEVQKEHKCNCALLTILTIISLILSSIALGLSTYVLTNGGGVGGEKKVVISTQYDKGKSLDKALKTKKPVIVFFYTDWCGFCQRFIPTYHKLSKDKEIKKDFAIAYVNCEDENNRKLMEEYEIQGFPTVFVVKDGKKTALDNNMLFSEEAIKNIKERVYEIIK